MPMIRPRARAMLHRAGDLIWALAIAAAGAWLVGLGGYLLTPIGVGLLALALGLALSALHRLRFQRPVAAPGVIVIDEGQIGYMGPSFGGYLSLRELAEIRLIRVNGLPHWRLKQLDGQALLIPHQATGSEGLFDAFASLPGADMATFSAALDRVQDTQLLWRRPTTP